MRWLIVLLLPALLTACDKGGNAASQEDPNAAIVASDALQARMNAMDGVDVTGRGHPLPTVALVDKDGAPVSLERFKGHPVLINLWATWCGPCVRELPSLQALAAKAPGGLQVVAVNEDGVSSADPAAYFAEHGITGLPLYRDAKGALTEFYATGVLPTSVLYDKDGNEVWRIVGGLEWDGPRADTLLAQVVG